MPTVCGGCQNVINRKKPEGWVLIQRPCKCKEPGTDKHPERLRVLPTDVFQGSDPDRRRLGLAVLTDREYSELPRDQVDRYGGNPRNARRSWQ